MTDYSLRLIFFHVTRGEINFSSLQFTAYHAKLNHWSMFKLAQLQKALTSSISTFRTSVTSLAFLI